MILGSIIALVVMGAAFAIAYPHLPPQIPLFYSRPWGEEQIADLWYIALLPILMLLMIGINTAVARRFPDQRFIPKLLTTVNWSIIVVTTGTFLRIVTIMSL